MVHHLFSRRHELAPDFPERVDLPRMTDKEAEAALGLLRLLVSSGAADVYTRPFTPEGERPRWNVWLGERITPGGQRLDLRDWAARALCRYDLMTRGCPDSPDSPDGGDAA
jgi:hypothetical protein